MLKLARHAVTVLMVPAAVIAIGVESVAAAHPTRMAVDSIPMPKE
jgi:hypothetical protein